MNAPIQQTEGSDDEKSLYSFLLSAGLLVVFSTMSTAAELGVRHFGIRGGVSANPDPFQGGVFVDAGRVSFVHLRPSFDLGFGNGVLLGAARHARTTATPAARVHSCSVKGVHRIR